MPIAHSPRPFRPQPLESLAKRSVWLLPAALALVFAVWIVAWAEWNDAQVREAHRQTLIADASSVEAQLTGRLDNEKARLREVTHQLSGVSGSSDASLAKLPDVVAGLEAGADDYMVKPFNPSELVARIRTRLRPPRTESSSNELRVGDVVIDLEGHRVTRAGTALNLTPLEFNLLAALAAAPTQVFTREMLLEQVWGYRYKADTRLVNVHVQRLRSKVEIDPDNPVVVATVRGIGYRAGAVSS